MESKYLIRLENRKEEIAAVFRDTLEKLKSGLDDLISDHYNSRYYMALFSKCDLLRSYINEIEIINDIIREELDEEQI